MYTCEEYWVREKYRSYFPGAPFGMYYQAKAFTVTALAGYLTGHLKVEGMDMFHLITIQGKCIVFI